VPQTLVIISLDPPIRKGQTFYNHILCQVGWEGGEERGRERCGAGSKLRGRPLGSHTWQRLRRPRHPGATVCLANRGTAV
jgi:hypothetical protein